MRPLLIVEKRRRIEAAAARPLNSMTVLLVLTNSARAARYYFLR
jgi:hypothetical protein